MECTERQNPNNVPHLSLLKNFWNKDKATKKSHKDFYKRHDFYRFFKIMTKILLPLSSTITWYMTSKVTMVLRTIQSSKQWREINSTYYVFLPCLSRVEPSTFCSLSPERSPQHLENMMYLLVKWLHSIQEHSIQHHTL